MIHDTLIKIQLSLDFFIRSTQESIEKKHRFTDWPFKWRAK